MKGTLLLVIVMTLVCGAHAGVATGTVLFSESFDDADLTKRNWYDGTEFRIFA